MEEVFIEIQWNEAIPPGIMIQEIDGFGVLFWVIILFDPQVFESAFQ
jgi:hypothetical protein